MTLKKHTQGKYMRGSRGFTLLELLVVIVILSILAGSVTFLNAEVNLTTYHEADELAASIRYVQSYSMTHADNYSVVISQSGGVWQYQLKLGADLLTNPSTGSTAPVLLSSTVTFSSGISGGVLTFDGRGAPYGNANAALTATAVITLAFEDDRNTEVRVTTRVGKVTVVPL